VELHRSRKGETADGMALLEKGLAVWEGGGGRVYNIAEVERPDRHERHYYAEALRVKGWLLSLKGDPESGTRLHRLARLGTTAASEVLGAGTATSYGRLMRDQGRVGKARELLAPIYGWFTEGSAAKDLREAKALLEELETSGQPARA
jgi:predicted ATPase